MKKQFIASAILLVTLIGCGSSPTTRTDAGSGVGGTDTHDYKSGTYNLWSYMTPASNHTNTYTLLNNGKQSKYQTTYSVKRNRVVESSSYASNEKTIYEKLNDTIRVKFEKNGQPNGMYELKLTVNEGDRITVRDSTCKLYKHYKSIDLNNRHFNDVLEIRCDGKPGYYQKGVGEIAQTSSTNPKQAVRVLAN